MERIIATSPETDFLDVGTGTGIAARQFQAAGCTVLGVEPDARLASFARRTGVKVEVAPFEAWDPAGREFDAVVAGHAWHFVDPVAGPARAARVLRPGGRLAAFWHLGQPPREVAEAFAAAWHGVVPGSPVNFRARPGQADRNAAAFTAKSAGRDPGGRRVQPPGAVAIRLGADLHPRRVARGAALYRFKTRRRDPELRFGLASRLRQDRGSCLSVCCI